MATENLPFRGRRTCICVIKIVPVVEAEMIRRGLIKRTVDFYQLGYNKGSVTASAGTHDRGGAMDTAQYTDAHLAVWRMFGVRMQRRVPPAFDLHGHGWPGGCPHMSYGLAYQESEWLHHRNGLVNRGPVTGPGWTTITWQQAIKKYAHISPTEVRDLDVAKWIRFNTAKPQALPVNKWAYLKVNDGGDISFGTGPGKLLGTISLRVNGLRAGDALQLRVVEDDVDGKTTRRNHSWPITELLGTRGDTFRVIPFTLNPSKSARGQRRIRAAVLAETKNVKITAAEIAYWKA